MLGKLHFVTGVVFLAPLALALFASGASPVEFSAIYILGVMLGTLLPDSDSSESKILNSRFRLPGLLTRYVLFLPAATLLYLVGFREARLHRGIMHSLVGLAAVTVFWGFVSLGVAKVVGLDVAFAAAFTGGVALGFLMHLYEDTLTHSGVKWLYPSRALLKGSMSTSYEGRHYQHFWETQYFAALIFIVFGVANGFLAIVAQTSWAVLALVSVFELLVLAAVFRVEAEEGYA